MNKLIERFKALGDETRFKIFLLLAEKRICVGGLAKVLEISESAVSQHLKILRNADLIKGEKVGYFMHYQVQKNILKELESLIGELMKDYTNMKELRDKFALDECDCMKVCETQCRGCAE